MQNIIDQIYVGSDKDDAEARRRGYSVLVCAKDANGGHREMLGYDTMGAPKGDDYLFVAKGHSAAMNCIDVDDSDMIPDKMIFAGLRWAKKEYDAGRTILFHCNAGRSRGPTTALMFMRAIGEFPQSFNRAKRIFKDLYPPFDPGVGMIGKSYELWDALPKMFEKD